MNLELCANVSRDLSPALDVVDLIPHAYQLEVSSPGVERPLRTERDFVRFAGQKARLKRRLERDRLGLETASSWGYSTESSTAACASSTAVATHEIPLSSIEAARLVFEFGSSGREVRSRGSTEDNMAIQQQQTGTGDLTLLQAIEMVAKDKGIDKARLVKTVEEAILKAAQSVFGANRELEARFNEDTGQVDLFQYMTVVDDVADDEREIAIEDAQRLGLEAEMGEELGFQIFWHPSDAKKAAEQDKEYGDILRVKQARQAFGRIAAQTAKQVLIQRVRDEERDLIFNEFKDRKGELIKGVVRRFEKGNNLIVDLGRTEGILPFREQTPRETYRPGDRIVAYVKDIDREARGPQVILSRSDPRLVEKLFEAEVPEIYEGIVKIVACAREPGARSKIAVTSRDADVDPVGACVGMKGARVQAVVQELRGEKIDIVPFDRDPARFVCAAIQPAEVSKVIVDEADGRMELVVPDEKLSLAIGRKGQNVRLAAQLSGWKLDIISEAKFKQMEEEAVTAAPADRRRHRGHRPRHVPPRLPHARRARRSERAGARRDAGSRRGRGGDAHSHERRDDDGAPAPGAHQRRLVAHRAAHRARAPALHPRRRRADRAAARGRRLPDRRGHPPRGRGQARHQDGPRHQEGARHQAGRRALPVERGEGHRGGAPRGRGPGAGGGADAAGRLRVEEEIERGR